MFNTLFSIGTYVTTRFRAALRFLHRIPLQFSLGWLGWLVSYGYAQITLHMQMCINGKCIEHSKWHTFNIKVKCLLFASFFLFVLLVVFLARAFAAKCTHTNTLRLEFKLFSNALDFKLRGILWSIAYTLLTVPNFPCSQRN